MFEDEDEDEDEGRFRKRRGTPVPVRRGFLSRIGVWLVGAVIAGIVPLVVALWAVSAAADYVPLLKQQTWAGAVGSAAIVTVTFSFVLFLQFLLYWKLGPSAGGADDVPIKGWRQFLIIYVLVPLVPGLVAGYLTLAPPARLLQAVDWIRQPSGSQVEREVGQAIRHAAAGDTRIAGLRALSQFGSPDALNELARLATGKPDWLNDPSSFNALAEALASFGGRSEPVLQSIWKESGHAGEASKLEEGRTPADLVLAAYSRLETIADTETAYAIAREAAFAPSSPPGRQAAAFAVIAKSGSRSDAAVLASFLVDRPESVKQAALDALRHLDARLKKQEPPPAVVAPAPAGR